MAGMRKWALLWVLSLALASCTPAAEADGATPLPAAETPSVEPSPESEAAPTATRTPAASPSYASEPAPFNYREQLTGRPSTLKMAVEELHPDTGEVLINGGDSRRPGIPFTVEWGDGMISQAWFPFQHTYADRGRNYLVQVTAHYPGDETGAAEILVRFTPIAFDPIPLPEGLQVSIPDTQQIITSRLFRVPDSLTFFDDGFFSGESVSRMAMEYVFSLAAYLQYDFTNGNVYSRGGGFRQVVLRDPDFPGVYTIWDSDPAAIIAGDSELGGYIPYAAFFHQMGHNFTLNTPAAYAIGEKIEGPARSVYAEAMATIFSLATAYEMLNNTEAFGLGDGLAFEIRQDAYVAMEDTRFRYKQYRTADSPFAAWDDPATGDDETLGVYKAIAFMFCEQAEQKGEGYREPLKRMMAMLQLFNPDWSDRYSQYANSPAAEAFRATWMVAALSYAFSADLRGEFKALNFPVDDSIYEDMLFAATT
jgi:hypothetical protein